MDYLLDPVAGSPSRGKTASGVVCLHVDDLFMSGDAEFHRVCASLRKDFQVGSEDINDIQFVGQRIKWMSSTKKNGTKSEGKHVSDHIKVDQKLCIDELSEIVFDKSLKEDVSLTPSMHTEYRSVLGQLNWLQSRTQFHIAYSFSRCASAAASPTIGDV